MKVKDLIESIVGDIDVYDDMTEELGIAYCGTQLTPAGRREFADVLELDCKIYVNGYTRAIVHVETEKQLNQAIKMFYSMAGYCTVLGYADSLIEKD